jgi:hypothetical protein
VALLAFVGLLPLTGIVPREHVRALSRIVRSLLPGGRRDDSLGDALERMQPSQRATLRLLARDGWSVSEVAEFHGRSESSVHERGVGALRTIAGLAEPRHSDPRIGSYLFSAAAVSERDARGRRLWADGMHPAYLHALEDALDRARRIPDHEWDEAARG